MSRARVVSGQDGEDVACAALERRGYVLVARRWRSRQGEIDVVAWDGPTLVFVEVKARRSNDYGGAAAAVTGAKQRRIARLAAEFCARTGHVACPCRFDVVAVRLDVAPPAVDVYTNAFSA